MNTAATYEHAQAMDRIRDKRQYRNAVKKEAEVAKNKEEKRRADQSEYAWEDWQNGVKGAKAPGCVTSKTARKATVQDKVKDAAAKKAADAKAKVLSGFSSIGLGGRKKKK